MSRAPVNFPMLRLENSCTPEIERAAQGLNEELVAFLLHIMQQESAVHKMLVVALLEELGELAADAVPTIASFLTHSSENTRMASALALMKMGEYSLSSLIEMLHSNEATGQLWAAWAVSFLQPAAIAEEIVKLLEGIRNGSASSVEKMAAQEALHNIATAEVS